MPPGLIIEAVRASQIFEKAVFTDVRTADARAKWALLLLLLLLLTVVYWALRDVVYERLVYGFAQRTFNELAGASLERIGEVEIDRQGDLIFRRVEAWTHRRGSRLFFRARELRLTLDGMPLRDSDLRVMRVDLIGPEIFVRREADGEWNLEWAVGRSPGVEAAPARVPEKDPWKDYLRPDDTFPRNGVHLHDGTVHVTFAARSGREVTWRVKGVRARLVKEDGVVRLDPCVGNFYGGRLRASAEVPRTSPFTIRQLHVDVRDADVSEMARGVPFILHPVRGRLNAVVALTVDREKLHHTRPIASGRCEITEGDLWELPAFSSIIHILALSPVSEKRIDTAVLEFTVEEDRIRIDEMHFLGYPVSLFGDGACSLTGDWIDVVFIPRLGKKDWNSILPIIGAPIDLLSNIFKGLFVPVSLTGSFDRPKLEVGRAPAPRPRVRALIEEKSPR